MENCKGRACALRHGAFVMTLLVLLGLGGIGYPSGVAVAGDPRKGEKLFVRHCALCHGNRSRSVMLGIPDFSWRGIGNDGRMLTDQKLLARIRFGGRGCPAFQGILSGREILDVITHLRTLR